jgi:hypothetical protein
MGQSTDAYLFWGFNLPAAEDEGGEEIAELTEDWEERFAVAKGVPLPPEYSDETKPAWHEFWEKKRALVKEAGCKVDSHCSCEYPTPFVTVEASFVRAWRGDPKPITSIDVGADWEAKLRAFCETMGIKWQTPGWWLASNWC